jgi:hypothetical protein
MDDGTAVGSYVGTEEGEPVGSILGMKDGREEGCADIDGP